VAPDRQSIEVKTNKFEDQPAHGPVLDVYFRRTLPEHALKAASDVIRLKVAACFFFAERSSEEATHG
jgi:hypothetical protein